MHDASKKAVAIATAIEALSDSEVVKALARELAPLLEVASIPAESADEDLRMENARLREELRRAKEAERKRLRRRASAGKASATPADARDDPRQTKLFHRPVDNTGQADVSAGRSDVPLSLTGSDHTNQIQRSESRVRGRPVQDIEPVAHDPDACPPDFVALAESIRADLPEAVIRFSWRSFAKRTRSHECLAAAMAHWENWIRNEDRAKAEKRMYTPFRPPGPSPHEPPDIERAPEPASSGVDLAEALPAPESVVQRLRATLLLPPLEPSFATPQDAMEALARIDSDLPEPRSMSA